MAKKLIILVKVLLGWLFLWAFLDKTFGLGFATVAEKAWIHGGSPTFGFLTNATKGPFAEIYQSLAGNPVVDWLFMMGLLFIGLSFMFDKFVKYSGFFGAIMMLLMYTAGYILPSNNPVIDDHIIYGVLFLYFAFDARAKEKKKKV